MRETSTILFALLSSLQFMICYIMIIIFLDRSAATDTITVSHSLSVGQTLISSGDTFKLGFFSPGNSNKLYIGIWFKNIQWRRAVWVANRENPLLASDTDSVLVVGQDSNLKILNGTGNTVWSTNVVSKSPANSTIAVLSDKGNLILSNSISGLTLWQSFDYPCDTLIAGMRIGSNSTSGEKFVLTSWKTLYDPSRGDYIYGLTTERPTQNIVWKGAEGLETHWRSGAWNGWTFIGVHNSYGGYSNGYIIEQDYQQGSVYGGYSPPSVSQVMVIVLTPDGNVNFTRYDTQTLQVASNRKPAIEISCDAYGVCGPFGFCDRSKSTCKCLKGFVPKLEDEWKKQNWMLGCVRQSELPCRKNRSGLTDGKKDVFYKMKGMKPPDHHVYIVSENSSVCEEKCSSNCTCEAYVYVDGIGCLTWSGGLIDIQKLYSGGVVLFIRLASGTDKERKGIKLIIISLGVIFLFVSVYCMYRCIANQKNLYSTPSRGLLDFIWGPSITLMGSSDIPMFSFKTLSAATKNFSQKNKLGGGGFGPVYKGKLENGQEIAAKRLSEHSGQGIVEFKNEISLISKLKHRNLVTLHGYCIKGDEKLLVYEYLTNKSLDNSLFDDKSEVQFDWAKRCDIIQGISRGLVYLHSDSGLRVIHRDLKASNILLDDKLNPKISDFGLARSFHITRELANTQRVVGTFGYMSPEYALRGLFSEKSDVFSFGVLLLEIISGMKNTSVHYQEKYLNLLGYAWYLWEQGRGLDLMDKRLNDTILPHEFIKYMQIGLLCVQDYAVDRPTMSLVVLMLTSDTDISQPKQPTFYQGLLNSDLQSHSSGAMSTNDISMSIAENQ